MTFFSFKSVICFFLIIFSFSFGYNFNSIDNGSYVSCLDELNDGKIDLSESFFFFVSKEECSNYSNHWISKTNCKQCINNGNKFCKNKDNDQGYCYSNDIDCGNDTISISFIEFCPCENLIHSGENCTETKCENGLFNPMTKSCECLEGWAGKDCSACSFQSSIHNHTLICCKIHQESSNWTLLAPSDNSLYEYLTGMYTIDPCVPVNSVLPDGTVLNCDCSTSEQSISTNPIEGDDFEYLSTQLLKSINLINTLNSPDLLADLISSASNLTRIRLVANQKQDVAIGSATTNKKGQTTIIILVTLACCLILALLLYLLAFLWTGETNVIIQTKKVIERRGRRRNRL